MNFKKRHPSDVSWNHIFHQCFTHIWHSWKVVKIETDEPNKRKFIECFSVISCYISCDHQKLILYSLLLMKILYLAFFLYYNHLLVGHPILWIYPISCLFCHFYAVRLPSVRMSFFSFSCPVCILEAYWHTVISIVCQFASASWHRAHFFHHLYVCYSVVLSCSAFVFLGALVFWNNKRGKSFLTSFISDLGIVPEMWQRNPVISSIHHQWTETVCSYVTRTASISWRALLV